MQLNWKSGETMKRSTFRSTFIALEIAAIPAIALPVISTQTHADSSRSTPAIVHAAQTRPALLPAALAGTWNIDAQHSRIGFAVRHLMINDVHGSFNDFEGRIVVNEKDPSQSSV